MIRIGFDPVLEAEQQHRELIKQVEQYRLAQEAMAGYQIKAAQRCKAPCIDRERNGPPWVQVWNLGLVKILMSRINMNTGSNPGGCTS